MGTYSHTFDLALSRMTLSKVSFSDILGNDIWDHFDTFERVIVDRLPLNVTTHNETEVLNWLLTFVKKICCDSAILSEKLPSIMYKSKFSFLIAFFFLIANDNFKTLTTLNA